VEIFQRIREGGSHLSAEIGIRVVRHAVVLPLPISVLALQKQIFAANTLLLKFHQSFADIVLPVMPFLVGGIDGTIPCGHCSLGELHRSIRFPCSSVNNRGNLFARH